MQVDGLPHRARPRSSCGRPVMACASACGWAGCRTAPTRGHPADGPSWPAPVHAGGRVAAPRPPGVILRAVAGSTRHVAPLGGWILRLRFAARRM